MAPKNKTARKTKKQLSPWNLFVMEVKKNNPEKSFKEVLVLASKLKKQGVKYGENGINKLKNVSKKINSTIKGKKSKKAKKSRKNKKN